MRKIADQHVQAIHRIADCQIVALCDQELFSNGPPARRALRSLECFSDVAKMLQTHIAGCRPHYHATAESLFHWAPVFGGRQSGLLALKSLLRLPARGEWKSLIELANHRNLKIVAGHNYQLTLEMLEMRRPGGRGYPGGSPVHLESYWPVRLGDTSYVGLVLGNPSHWVRQLPGRLIHNIISHGIARLAEFLDDGQIEIVARSSSKASSSGIWAARKCWTSSGS